MPTYLIKTPDERYCIGRAVGGDPPEVSLELVPANEIGTAEGIWAEWEWDPAGGPMKLVGAERYLAGPQEGQPFRPGDPLRLSGGHENDQPRWLYSADQRIHYVADQRIHYVDDKGTYIGCLGVDGVGLVVGGQQCWELKEQAH